MNGSEKARSTTVVAVLRNGRLALGADGQVTLGETVMKQGAEMRLLRTRTAALGWKCPETSP